MMPASNFDDVLDAALDALTSGEPVGRILARHADHAPELAPLLETALAAQAAATATRGPISTRLEANYAAVREALAEARAARPPAAAGGRPAGRTRWSPRLAFASMSLPVSAMLAVATVGAGSAATVAGVIAAVRGDDPIAAVRRLPAAVADAVKPVIPGGSEDGVTPTADAFAPAAPGGAGTQPASSFPIASPSEATKEPPGEKSAPATPPGADNGPRDLTVSGTVRGLQGNSRNFTLVTGGAEYNVVVTGSTGVIGTLVDGASATVTGTVTADKNLRATLVTVPANAGDAPIAGETARPAETRPAATPDKRADKTPGPPPDRTPPGREGDTPGNGNSNGNSR